MINVLCNKKNDNVHPNKLEGMELVKQLPQAAFYSQPTLQVNVCGFLSFIQILYNIIRAAFSALLCGGEISCCFLNQEN